MLSLETADHEELLQYWLACQPGTVLEGGGAAGGAAPLASSVADGGGGERGAADGGGGDSGGAALARDAGYLLKQLQQLQGELDASAERCSRLRPRRVAVQVHAVEQTLDALHSAVLESVEKQFGLYAEAPPPPVQQLKNSS